MLFVSLPNGACAVFGVCFTSIYMICFFRSHLCQDGTSSGLVAAVVHYLFYGCQAVCRGFVFDSFLSRMMGLLIARRVPMRCSRCHHIPKTCRHRHTETVELR